jgi:hypothetical protein
MSEQTIPSEEALDKAAAQFKVGDRVQRKEPRSYAFPGVVIGIAPKLDGVTTLYTVECLAPGVTGMAHEFVERGLEPLDADTDRRLSAAITSWGGDLVPRADVNACAGCGGNPAPENNPCAVCGATSALATMQADLARVTAERDAMREALSDMQGDGKQSGTWADCVGPLIARFEIAASFGADAVHNGTGAKAIADLMRSMAERLDRACLLARQALEPKP